MNIDVAALLAPVSDSAPAGEEARSTESYDLVSSEIDKMTSLSGAAPVDWHLVAQHGADVLRSQSKDFMMAAWVSTAWMENHGLRGLKAGLELHAGLVDTYWETAFPPLKRLRGRRNALAWWLERASNWLDNNTPPPVEADTHTAMVDAATRLDQGLADRDPDAPPLGAFLRQVKQLDVIEEAVIEAVPAGSELEAGAEPGSDAGGSHTRPVDAIAASTASTTGASMSTSRIAPANFSHDQELATLDDIIDVLEPVTQYLSQIGSALLEVDRFQPLLIDIIRFAARSTLLSPPPATGGRTALMAPPSAIMDAFATICGAGNAEGIIGFCESRIATFPFWLDLDYHAARAYAMLGEAGAPMQKAVIKNTLSFVDRMPGLEDLSFSDGTPFASEETRQWLEECRSQGNGADPDDSFSIVQAQARAAANDGRHDDAMQLYQSLIQGTYSGRDQFRARIALIELLMAAYGDLDPMPLAQPLLDDCIDRKLAAWEPALAAQAWQTVLKACRQALANPQISQDIERRQRYQTIREETLRQLARVDFPTATRFLQ